jgi:hypothetical protein
MSSLVIATDLDGMLYAFPRVLIPMFKELQKAGNKVGILTAELDSNKDEIKDRMKELDFEPDFIITKPDALDKLPNGIYKGKVCKDLGIDLLYDDFQYSSGTMIADFFSTNEGRTEPFTGFAYRPWIDE